MNQAIAANRHPRRTIRFMPIWALCLAASGICCCHNTPAGEPPPAPLRAEDDAREEDEEGALPVRDDAEAAESAAPFAAPVPAIDPEELRTAIDDSLDYLVANCRPDGQFVYVRHAPLPDITPAKVDPDRYNMLRHAGAMYALAEGACRERERARAGVDGAAERLEAIREAFGRAADYLAGSIGPMPGVPDALAVWSNRGGGRPLSWANRFREAKLGGAGLALIAVCRMEAFAPGAGKLPEETRRGLARFIAAMQREDGSFVSKVDMEGEADDFESLYYPGEAALGLAWLARVESDPEAAERWRGHARRALLRLAGIRAGSLRVPADHWALLATRLVIEDWDDPEAAPQRERLLVHAAQVTGVMLQEQLARPEDPRLEGSFRLDGALCPASIRLEGLLAALAFFDMRGKPELTEWFESAVNRGIGLLLRCRVREGGLRGGMPRLARPLPDSGFDNWFESVQDARQREQIKLAAERHRRGVARQNRRAGEVRVDYVQHAVCAFMELERRLAGGTGKP